MRSQIHAFLSQPLLMDPTFAIRLAAYADDKSPDMKGLFINAPCPKLAAEAAATTAKATGQGKKLTAVIPIYGLIDQPYIRERFEGGLGRALVTGPSGVSPLRCRGARPLGEAILFSTFPEVGTPEEGAAFRRVAQRAKLVRYGTDCYAYALVAAGMIDLVIEAGLQAYDVQAPIAVIEAAGGIMTDWQGRPCHDGGRVLAAANAEIHAEALALLNG